MSTSGRRSPSTRMRGRAMRIMSCRVIIGRRASMSERERLELYSIAFENRAGSVAETAIRGSHQYHQCRRIIKGRRASPPPPGPTLPLLAAHADTLRAHDRHYKYAVSEIGNLKDFCFRRTACKPSPPPRLHQRRWHYREWAPAATACSLVGDFNSWDPTRHPCRVNADGVFYVFVPDDHDGLRPGSRYKAALTVRSRAGRRAARPLYARMGASNAAGSAHRRDVRARDVGRRTAPLQMAPSTACTASEDGPAGTHLRGACRHLGGGAEDCRMGALSTAYIAARRRPRIHRPPTHCRTGAWILRLVRISSLLIPRTALSIRLADGASGAR